MDATNNSSTALLTEHLRHTPSLIDDVINSINTIGYAAVDWVEQGLLRAPLTNLGYPDLDNGGGSSSETEAIQGKVQHEIENGAHQFETLLEAAIDKNFDKMEIFALRSIIAIPEDLKDWIRLRHYEGLNFTISPDAPTIESITLQRRKYQETQRLHRLLEAEAARNASLIAQLKAVLFSSHLQTNPSSQVLPKAEPTDHVPEELKEPRPYATLAFLSQTGDLSNSSAAAPLNTTTGFALSQLPAMKTLLADLRPALKTLSALASTANDPNLAVSTARAEEDESWRRQRLGYVEAQTKRLQENLRGLELGAQGEVRDGEWQEQGRRIGRGEVDALGRVVAMVSGKEMDSSV